ncbi:MAG: hypothetical protein ABS79_07700 [Planctomycetes bacterium SCN 63-9]|nr:MAG: hypothetical protein ABS79_07700 [Planctomycetes bacterium SCN 63-9]
MLKFTRPRKEWTFDELASSVTQLEHGRSFRGAEKIFQAATCVSCHRVNGIGNEFGPDLTKLDPKTTSAEILKSILDPSAKIDDKYVTTLIETDSGQVISGLILKEDDSSVTVIENPLAKAEARVIKKDEIVGRKKSTTSMMPKGLLDKLTREEIIDLISFIAARGDKNNSLFQGGHAGHGH